MVMEFSSLENKRIQLENVIQSSRIACDATVEAKIVRKVEGNVTLTINGGSGDADSMKQFLEESFEQDSWVEDPDVIRQIDESQMVPVGRM
jgi:phage gp45-like